MPAIGERRQLPDAAERFGILLHALLERRTAGEVTEAAEAAIPAWLKENGFSESDYRRVLPLAEGLLAAPDLQRFFDPSRYRRAWNEVELTTGDGLVQRLDRLVEFDDAFWIIDYKSSRSDTVRLEDYRRQVAQYCDAVARVFPGRAVRGALVFSDASLLEISAPEMLAERDV